MSVLHMHNIVNLHIGCLILTTDYILFKINVRQNKYIIKFVIENIICTYKKSFFFHIFYFILSYVIFE